MAKPVTMFLCVVVGALIAYMIAKGFEFELDTPLAKLKGKAPVTPAAPPPPPPQPAPWIRYEVSDEVKSGGGTRAFDFVCTEGYRPIGFEPNTSFPARIDVEKLSPSSWKIYLLNLHGSHRPPGKATLTLVCVR